MFAQGRFLSEEKQKTTRSSKYVLLELFAWSDTAMQCNEPPPLFFQEIRAFYLSLSLHTLVAPIGCVSPVNEIITLYYVLEN